jgi:hypothetical protein
MTQELFAQCVLEREESKKIIRAVYWIQAHHKQGSRVRDDDNKIWVVKEKGKNFLPEDVVKQNSSDYRRHRDATDV